MTPVKVFVSVTTESQLRTHEERSAGNQIAPSLRRARFLHLAAPSDKVGAMREAVSLQCAQLTGSPAPHLTLLESHFCRVPDDYHVRDVFEAGSEAYAVITGTAAKRRMPDHQAASTPVASTTERTEKFREKRQAKRARKQQPRADSAESPAVASPPTALPAAESSSENGSEKDKETSIAARPGQFMLFGPSRLKNMEQANAQEPKALSKPSPKPPQNEHTAGSNTRQHGTSNGVSKNSKPTKQANGRVASVNGSSTEVNPSKATPRQRGRPSKGTVAAEAASNENVHKESSKRTGRESGQDTGQDTGKETGKETSNEIGTTKETGKETGKVAGKGTSKVAGKGSGKEVDKEKSKEIGAQSSDSVNQSSTHTETGGTPSASKDSIPNGPEEEALAEPTVTQVTPSNSLPSAPKSSKTPTKPASKSQKETGSAIRKRAAESNQSEYGDAPASTEGTSNEYQSPKLAKSSVQTNTGSTENTRKEVTGQSPAAGEHAKTTKEYQSPQSNKLDVSNSEPAKDTLNPPRATLESPVDSEAETTGGSGSDGDSDSDSDGSFKSHVPKRAVPPPQSIPDDGSKRKLRGGRVRGAAPKAVMSQPTPSTEPPVEENPDFGVSLSQPPPTTGRVPGLGTLSQLSNMGVPEVHEQIRPNIKPRAPKKTLPEPPSDEEESEESSSDNASGSDSGSDDSDAAPTPVRRRGGLRLLRK